MTDPQEVVITGMGIVSPLGVGPESFWDNLAAGRSAVKRLEHVAGTPFPIRIGAPFSGFDPKKYVQPRKSLKVMCVEIQAAFSAAVLGLAEAKLAGGAVDPDRFGVVLGADPFFGDLGELEEVFRHCLHDGVFHFGDWGERAMTDIFPLWMLKYLPNMAACHIAIAQDARGPNNTIVQGDASSLLALIEACGVIERGAADVMLAGATSSRLAIPCLVYRHHEETVRGDETPERASRPFDLRRQGQVLGEGCCVFVLESKRHAEARGAPVLARVAGYGRTCQTQAEDGSDAVARSIVAALRMAKLAPHEVGHVNAHGLSTRRHDAIEAQGIRAALGDTPVIALKSYFGNLGAGGAAVQMAGSVLALARDLLPVTLNYETRDPACPVNVATEAALPAGIKTAVVLSQSNTGQAAAIALDAR